MIFMQPQALVGVINTWYQLSASGDSSWLGSPRTMDKNSKPCLTNAEVDKCVGI